MFSGVIEGFYGKAWSFEQRRSMIDFLKREGFSHYIYAPKSDRFLRNTWQENWPEDQWQALAELSQYAKEQGIHFGFGLSPISLVDNWDDHQREQLRIRLKEINCLQPASLAILFDDIQGDKLHLAARQIEIMQVVAEYLPDTHLLMCPTYYSFDPILEQLFGQMPKDYWQSLGEQLPARVDILWTGDQVISNDYDAQSLAKITSLFKRKPVIWDNSRVNDGRKTSPFLPVKAMFSLSDLAPSVNGLLVNPANQPSLACVNLKTLRLEGTAEQKREKALAELAPSVYQDVINCLDFFTEVGVDALTDEDKHLISSLFSASNEPLAREIMQWLNGEFRFDPACLT